MDLNETSPKEEEEENKLDKVADLNNNSPEEDFAINENNEKPQESPAENYEEDEGSHPASKVETVVEPEDNEKDVSSEPYVNIETIDVPELNEEIENTTEQPITQDAGEVEPQNVIAEDEHDISHESKSPPLNPSIDQKPSVPVSPHKEEYEENKVNEVKQVPHQEVEEEIIGKDELIFAEKNSEVSEKEHSGTHSPKQEPTLEIYENQDIKLPSRKKSEEELEEVTTAQHKIDQSSATPEEEVKSNTNGVLDKEKSEKNVNESFVPDNEETTIPPRTEIAPPRKEEKPSKFYEELPFAQPIEEEIKPKHDKDEYVDSASVKQADLPLLKEKPILIRKKETKITGKPTLDTTMPLHVKDDNNKPINLPVQISGDKVSSKKVPLPEVKSGSDAIIEDEVLEKFMPEMSVTHKSEEEIIPVVEAKELNQPHKPLANSSTPLYRNVKHSKSMGLATQNFETVLTPKLPPSKDERIKDTFVEPNKVPVEEDAPIKVEPNEEDKPDPILVQEKSDSQIEPEEPRAIDKAIKDTQGKVEEDAPQPTAEVDEESKTEQVYKAPVNAESKECEELVLEKEITRNPPVNQIILEESGAGTQKSGEKEEERLVDEVPIIETTSHDQNVITEKLPSEPQCVENGQNISAEHQGKLSLSPISKTETATENIDLHVKNNEDAKEAIIRLPLKQDQKEPAELLPIEHLDLHKEDDANLLKELKEESSHEKGKEDQPTLSIEKPYEESPSEAAVQRCVEEIKEFPQKTKADTSLQPRKDTEPGNEESANEVSSLMRYNHSMISQGEEETIPRLDITDLSHITKVPQMECKKDTNRTENQDLYLEQEQKVPRRTLSEKGQAPPTYTRSSSVKIVRTVDNQKQEMEADESGSKTEATRNKVVGARCNVIEEDSGDLVRVATFGIECNDNGSLTGEQPKSLFNPRPMIYDKTALNVMAKTYLQARTRAITWAMGTMKDYALSVKHQAYLKRGYNAALKIIIRTVKTEILREFKQFQDATKVIYKVNIGLMAGSKKLRNVLTGKLKQKVSNTLKALKQYAEKKKLAQRQVKLGVNTMNGVLRSKLLPTIKSIAEYAKSRDSELNEKKVKLREMCYALNKVNLRMSFELLRNFATAQKMKETTQVSFLKGARATKHFLMNRMRALVESLKSSIMLKVLNKEMTKTLAQRALRSLIHINTRITILPYWTLWYENAQKAQSLAMKRKNAQTLFKTLNNCYKSRLTDSFDRIRIFATTRKLIQEKEKELNALISVKDSEYRNISEQHFKSLKQKEAEIRRSRQRELAIKVHTVLQRKIKAYLTALKEHSKTQLAVYVMSESVPIPLPREETPVQNIAESVLEEVFEGLCDNTYSTHEIEQQVLKVKQPRQVLVPSADFNEINLPFSRPQENIRAVKPEETVNESPVKVKVPVEAYDKEKAEHNVNISVLSDNVEESPKGIKILEDNASEEEDRVVLYTPKEGRTENVPKVYIGEGKSREVPEKPTESDNKSIEIDSKAPELISANKEKTRVASNKKADDSKMNLPKQVAEPQKSKETASNADSIKVAKRLAQKPVSRAQGLLNPSTEEAKTVTANSSSGQPTVQRHSQEPRPMKPNKRKYPPRSLARFMTQSSQPRNRLVQYKSHQPREPLEPDTKVQPLQTHTQKDETWLSHQSACNPHSLEEEDFSLAQIRPGTFAGGSDTGTLDLPGGPVTPVAPERFKKMCAEMLSTPDTYPLDKSRISGGVDENSAVGMADPVELEAPSWSAYNREQYIEPADEEKPQSINHAGRYDHKRFMQAFSECFVKYHDKMAQEEQEKQGESPLPKIMEPSHSPSKFNESPIPSSRTTNRKNYHAEYRRASAKETLIKASSEKELRELLTRMNEDRPKCVLTGHVAGPDVSKNFKTRLQRIKKENQKQSKFIRSNIQMVKEISKRFSKDQGSTTSPRLRPSATTSRLGRTMGITVLQTSGGSLTLVKKQSVSKDRLPAADFIDINKKFIKEMSHINHEINSQYTCLAHVPRFKVPKPELVFQLTKYKAHIQSRSVMTKLSSSINTSTVMHSPLETYEKLKFMNLNQSQGIPRGSSQDNHKEQLIQTALQIIITYYYVHTAFQLQCSFSKNNNNNNQLSIMLEQPDALPSTKSEAFEQLRFYIFEAKQCLSQPQFSAKIHGNLDRVLKIADLLEEMVNSEPLQDNSEVQAQLAELKVRIEVKDIESLKMKEDLDKHKAKSSSTINVFLIVLQHGKQGLRNYISGLKKNYKNRLLEIQKHLSKISSDASTCDILKCRVSYFLQNDDAIPSGTGDNKTELILEGDARLESNENTMRSIRHQDAEYRKSQLLKARNKEEGRLAEDEEGKSLQSYLNQSINGDENNLSELSLTEREKLAFNYMNQSLKQPGLNDVKMEEVMQATKERVLPANELESLLDKLNESGQKVCTIEKDASLNLAGSDTESDQVPGKGSPKLKLCDENKRKGKEEFVISRKIPPNEHRHKLQKKLQVKVNHMRIHSEARKSDLNYYKPCENSKPLSTVYAAPLEVPRLHNSKESSSVDTSYRLNKGSPVKKARHLKNPILISRPHTSNSNLNHSKLPGSVQIIPDVPKQVQLGNITVPKDSIRVDKEVAKPYQTPVIVNKNYGDQHHQVNVQINLLGRGGGRKNILRPCLKLAKELVTGTAQTPTVRRAKNSAGEQRAASQIGRQKNINQKKKATNKDTDNDTEKDFPSVIGELRPRNIIRLNNIRYKRTKDKSAYYCQALFQLSHKMNSKYSDQSQSIIINQKDIMTEITMVTADGQKLKSKFDAMKVCKPIEEFYKDNKPEVEIILQEVKAETLALIIEFCNQYHNKSAPVVEKPLKTNKLAEVIKDEWLLAKLNMPLSKMYDLLSACDYLALKSLEELVACAVAVKIMGKDVEEIRKEFGITNDYTPAEEAEIKEFFTWSEELWGQHHYFTEYYPIEIRFRLYALDIVRLHS
eukprot:TRINITY_DN470_c1_g1_i1.p1 TRINITY_DN470_c1_g1~~TRINITY_DN470_c1_g1_i1.p1  ORF type:complete len:3177 (-),score=433.80 TRINITY_DN470_c1_g1_i1:1470-10295(-)